MDYRDDRDAMRGRIENLEQDLAAANREIEERRRAQDPARLAELEAQLAEARRKLDDVGGELARLRGTRRPANALAVVIGVMTIAGGVLGFSVFAVRRPPPIAAPPAPVLPVEAAPKPAVTTPPAPVSPVVPGLQAKARWTGSVTRATGLTLAPGTACVLDATLEGGARGIVAKELSVSCGGKVLYRSTDKLEGMSMNSSGAAEEPGPSAGTQVYQLAYHDKGTRTGARNEISLDTESKTGAVWRDSAPMWRVELSIAPKSAPVQGDALAR